MSSFKVDLKQLYNLIDRIKSPVIRDELMKLNQNKGVIAIVAQAISDNFLKEGPGWKPLSSGTIRSSVAKGLRKNLDAKANTITNKKGEVKQARQILRKTNLLYKSVTTPGAQGNVNKTQGTNLVWGTNLHYAAIHNNGGTIRNPGTKNGFGKGIKIPPHSISIPKREFLVIRQEWKEQLNAYCFELMVRIIKKHLKGGG